MYQILFIVLFTVVAVNACGPYGRILECGSACEPSCQNYKYYKHLYCTQMCTSGGCRCDDGYVLDYRTYTCIQPKECNEKINKIYQKYYNKRKGFNRHDDPLSELTTGMGGDGVY